MGYMWAIPVVIITLLVVLAALGTRRRRRGADRTLDKNKAIVP